MLKVEATTDGGKITEAAGLTEDHQTDQEEDNIEMVQIEVAQAEEDHTDREEEEEHHVLLVHP
jgi:hypothetical protein